jgi:Flp pilus assembly protein TadD
MVLVAGDNGHTLAETLEALKGQSSAPLHIAGHVMGVPEGAGSIMTSGEQSVPAAILEFARTSTEDVIIFISEGAVPTPGWTTPLEAVLKVDDVGCAVPATNAGWGLQRLTPSYQRTGKPLVKFARKNALEHRGRVENMEAAFPAAMAVKREVLLKVGLADEFTTGAVFVDLQRRIRDAGLRIVCARDSYVHFEGESDGTGEVEQDAAFKLQSAGDKARQGEIDSALADVDGAITIKPDYVEAHYQRGVLLALAGRPDEARAEFEDVVSMTPRDSRAHNNLGCLLFEAGRGPEAEESFLKALEADGDNWEAKRNLADLYLAGGRAQDGMNLYQNLLQEHNERPEIHAAVARVFAAQGDTETAAMLLKTAARLAPGDEMIRKALEEVDAARAGSEEVGTLET